MTNDHSLRLNITRVEVKIWCRTIKSTYDNNPFLVWNSQNFKKTRSPSITRVVNNLTNGVKVTVHCGDILCNVRVYMILDKRPTYKTKWLDKQDLVWTIQKSFHGSLYNHIYMKLLNGFQTSNSISNWVNFSTSIITSCPLSSSRPLYPRHGPLLRSVYPFWTFSSTRQIWINVPVTF